MKRVVVGLLVAALVSAIAAGSAYAGWSYGFNQSSEMFAFWRIQGHLDDAVKRIRAFERIVDADARAFLDGEIREDAIAVSQHVHLDNGFYCSDADRRKLAQLKDYLTAHPPRPDDRANRATFDEAVRLCD
ncbi:MAG TPA: hypothetical protein VM029_04875 [Opitutaceae bacterium]|nr:hypothetical protein [Opitutaceae bacterium]